MSHTAKIKLIPYEVERIISQVSEIPIGVKMMNAPTHWKKNDQGAGIVVAVLDTGCDPHHLDLEERIIGGRNFTSEDQGDLDAWDDQVGHGTHIAGTIASSLNGFGVVGIAPEAQLLIVKVLGNDGTGTYESLIQGIQYATQWQGPNGERVQVINLSLEGLEDVEELHLAIQKAIEAGILVVCATTNSEDDDSSTNEIYYPGAYPEVVSVGAVDQQKKITPFTSTENQLDFIAPGVDILSCYPNNQYAILHGTTMASSHISGAAALLISEAEKRLGRKLTEDEILGQLCKNANMVGLEARIEGNGFVVLGKR